MEYQTKIKIAINLEMLFYRGKKSWLWPDSLGDAGVLFIYVLYK